MIDSQEAERLDVEAYERDLPTEESKPIGSFEKTITIGHRWFSTVKKDYTDWRFAWAREAGQNSLDAGATAISVTVELNGEGNTSVVWSDNGCGMNERILEDKFMAIGGSEKPNGGTGGFGIAKLILAFAQMSYSIRTQDIEAKGSGAGYSIEKNMPYYKGLTLSVVMEGDQVWGMTERIKRWVRFTTTKCGIALNGEALTTLRMHRPKLETPWCKVYTHKIDGYEDKIRVRMNRQYMFDIYTSVNAKITVDINGTDSQKYLTSNRDGMNWEWQHKLQKLVEELYDDPNKIKVEEDTVERYEGKEGKVEFKKAKAKKKVSLAAVVTPAPVGIITAMGGIKTSLPQQSTVTGVTMKSTFATVKELIEGYDIVVSNSTSKTIPDKWIPGKMNGVTSKLMNRWIRVLQTCGIILNRWEEICPGWTFDTDARASYRYHPEFGHMILLNPVDIGETSFKNHFTNCVGDFYEMVALAVHEITHIDCGSHNTAFARDITYSMGKVMAQVGLLEIVRKETA